MFPVQNGALRTIDSPVPETAADGDANRHSDSQPDREMSCGDPECGAQRRSQRDA